MLQQVLSQLAGCSTNTVNIGFVERGDNGSSLNIEQVVKISKLVARFFERMENHILVGIPAFTPRDANPNHKSAMSAAAVYVGECIPTERASTTDKVKADVSPPSTPACDRQTKSRGSSQVLVRRTSPKRAFSTARKEPQSMIYSLQI